MLFSTLRCFISAYIFIGTGCEILFNIHNNTRDFSSVEEKSWGEGERWGGTSSSFEEQGEFYLFFFYKNIILILEIASSQEQSLKNT